MNYIRQNSYFILAGFLFILFITFQLPTLIKEETYVTVTVQEGDTLWDYAENYRAGTSRDKWLQQVAKLNDLPTATIQTGTELKLPIKQKDVHTTELAGN